MTAAAQRLALRDAAHWYARLGAAPGCAATQADWRAWLQQDALHAWAWQRLEALQNELRGLPPTLTRNTLATDLAQPTRRLLLKGLVVGIGLSGLAWTGYRQTPLWLADLRTATGERRHVVLADGTQLILNTATAVDIRFSADQRLIILRAGEILVTTAKDPRPLSVRSRHGDMRALGTRFSVRQEEDATDLQVLEHAVAVRNQPAMTPLRVEAGMGLRFADGPLGAPQPLDPNSAEWANGRLVIDNWRLDRTLAELQRYRPGFIQCTEEVAHLRLSGAYPLDDSDRALAAIAKVLPVRIDQRTRYWIRVRGRD